MAAQKSRVDTLHKEREVGMKKSMALILVILLGGLVSAQAFTQPTAEQLKAAANDPTQMKSLLQGASKEEAAQVIIAVVGEVEKLQIPLPQKKQRVAAIFDESRVDLGGGHKAEAVIEMVLSNIKPEFHPPRPPHHPPRPPHHPPKGPKYKGQ